MAGKKQGRRDYLNDFHRDSQGKYSYSGEIFRYSGEKSFQRVIRNFCAASGIAFAAVIAAGCVPAPGMTGCFYVLIPYVIELGFAAMTLASFVRVLRSGEELRAYVYRSSILKLPMYIHGLLLTAGAGAAAETVFLVQNRADERMLQIILLYICKGAVLTASFFMRKQLADFSFTQK